MTTTRIELEFTNMMSNPVVIGGGGGGIPAQQGLTVRITQPAGSSAEGSDASRPVAHPRTILDSSKDFQFYKPNMFTITAYLPNDGMEGEKRLKV